jgi:hypothetical protein
MKPGGWPSRWGALGDQITYTCTRLRNDGSYFHYAGSNDFGSYVDSMAYGKWIPNDRFYSSDAIRADGASVTLTALRFVKVQTAFLGYGNIVYDLCTEVYAADGLGRLTNFPKP